MPPVTGALTTVTAAAEALGVTVTTTVNTKLSNLINRASAMIEGYCGRKFAAASYTETVDGDGSASLYLRNYPIIAVGSLYNTSDRSFTAGNLVSAGNYFVYKSVGKVVLTGACFQRDRLNVRCTYSAGWATIPYEVESACIAIVGQMWNGTTDGMQSESIMDYSYNRGAGAASMIKGQADVLDQYKRSPLDGVTCL